MSEPGYGSQNGPYPPGSPFPADPQGTQASDPWAQPATAPVPPTYGLTAGGYPPASAPPAGQYPTGQFATGQQYAAAPGPAQGGPYATAPLPTAAEVGPSAYGRPPAGRNRLVVILGAATALLLVLGLTMTGLYVAKSGEQSDTQTELTAARDTISERDAKVSTLEKDLADTKTELTNTQQQLDGTKDSLGTANSDKQIIAQCLKLVIEALDAIGKGDQAKTDSLVKQLDEPCTKAEKVI